MSEVDKDYELKVLKMTINKYLDETVTITEEGLKSLKANRDRLVWELATKIYTQSGHKVEFSIVRDVINSRIEAIKAQLEEANRLAEKKARQVAEEACRAAEEKARQLAEEARLREQITNILRLGGDESKASVFLRVREIVSYQLSVDASKVNLESHLSNDLGADDLDLVELVMALEKEFNIEIPDSVVDIVFSYSSASFWNMSSGSAYSSPGGGGPNCIIKNFVDYIYNKVSTSA